MQKEKFIVGEADVTSRSRAINKPGMYMLLPASSRVFSGLPGFSGARAQVMAAPQLGAKFVEYELFVEPGGKTIRPLRQDLQHFFYVLEGGLTFECNGKAQELEPGCFAWLPPQATFSFVNQTHAQTRMVWIRKPYEKAEGIEVPGAIIRHESEVSAAPTDTYMEQHLTPYEDIAFDMGINLQVFDPGVYFSFAETHIMEHGLYMLYGRGIYWLNSDFMEVQQGDFIYMAPYCPQFYYATGWEKSAYLLYKDVNRDYAAQL